MTRQHSSRRPGTVEGPACGTILSETDRLADEVICRTADAFGNERPGLEHTRHELDESERRRALLDLAHDVVDLVHIAEVVAESASKELDDPCRLLAKAVDDIVEFFDTRLLAARYRGMDFWMSVAGRFESQGRTGIALLLIDHALRAARDHVGLASYEAFVRARTLRLRPELGSSPLAEG